MLTSWRNRHALPRSSRGFSMVELMVTLAIVTLVSGVVATGMPVVVDAYTRVVDTANAQAQLTGAAAVFRDLLGHATRVEVDIDHGTRVVWFRDGETGRIVHLRHDDVDGIQVARMPDEDDTPSDNDWKQLMAGIKSQRKGWELVVGYESLTYKKDEQTFEITNLKVWRSSDSGASSGGLKSGPDNPLAHLDKVYVRRMPSGEWAEW